MGYGIRYDRKLNKWVIYRKETGKLVGRYETEEKARAQLRLLLTSGVRR